MLNKNVRRLAKVSCLAVVFFLLIVIISVLVESANIEITATKDDGSTENLSWWIGVFVPLVGASVIATLVSFSISNKEKNQIQKRHQKELTSTERKASELEKLNYATNQELIRAQISIVSQERWKERAIKCNPEIEQLVLESFAIDEVDNFQKDYPELETLQACHNNYSVFVKVLNAYHRLSDEAKTILSLNLETIRQKLRESLADYINFARKYLKDADSKLEGTPENLDEITKVINWFENIPVTVQNQIPSTLVTSLMMKKANAEYQNALLSSDVEAENEPEEIGIFKKISNWAILQLSNLWLIIKNCFKNKMKAIHNYFTRPLEYEYQDEVLDENEEVQIENVGDDTDENPDYI